MDRFCKALLVFALPRQSRRPQTAGSIALLCTISVLAGCSGASSTVSKPGTLILATSSLPNGQVGAAYSVTLTATGGTAPYTWSWSSGSLPAGLSLNASTGAITGTPTTSVSATPLTVRVTDSGNPTQSQSGNLTLTILPSGSGSQLTITTSSLPAGQIGIAYSATLTATGGNTPYTWSLTGGTLPAGLTLNTSTGAITGTPTAAVTASALTFAVTDSGSPAQTKSISLSITISAASPATLTITTSSLPQGRLGSPTPLRSQPPAAIHPTHGLSPVAPCPRDSRSTPRLGRSQARRPQPSLLPPSRSPLPTRVVPRKRNQSASVSQSPQLLQPR